MFLKRESNLAVLSFTKLDQRDQICMAETNQHSGKIKVEGNVGLKQKSNQSKMVPDLNDTEIITVTKNIYYDM